MKPKWNINYWHRNCEKFLPHFWEYSSITDRIKKQWNTLWGKLKKHQQQLRFFVAANIAHVVNLENSFIRALNKLKWIRITGKYSNKNKILNVRPFVCPSYDVKSIIEWTNFSLLVASPVGFNGTIGRVHNAVVDDGEYAFSDFLVPYKQEFVFQLFSLGIMWMAWAHGIYLLIRQILALVCYISE